MYAHSCLPWGCDGANKRCRLTLVNANFREAIKSGDKDTIEREGAKKLQSAWRIKQAKKEAQARKEEALRALLDAAARKVQSCYRIRFMLFNLSHYMQLCFEPLPSTIFVNCWLIVGRPLVDFWLVVGPLLIILLSILNRSLI